MTETQTEAFHSQKATGMTNQEAFDSVTDYADQRGNRNASAMVLPDWAKEAAGSEWMRAALKAGMDAYPREIPAKMDFDGDGELRELTDEERAVFERKYKTAYQLYITEAMESGEDLTKAAEKAYSAARKSFRKEIGK